MDVSGLLLDEKPKDARGPSAICSRPREARPGYRGGTLDGGCSKGLREGALWMLLQPLQHFVGPKQT